jgi:hypothetical protein
MPQVIAEVGGYATRRGQPPLVEVEIHAVDAFQFQDHMFALEFGDVVRHKFSRLRLGFYDIPLWINRRLPATSGSCFGGSRATQPEPLLSSISRRSEAQHQSSSTPEEADETIDVRCPTGLFFGSWAELRAQRRRDRADSLWSPLCH